MTAPKFLRAFCYCCFLNMQVNSFSLSLTLFLSLRSWVLCGVYCLCKHFYFLFSFKILYFLFYLLHNFYCYNLVQFPYIISKFINIYVFVFCCSEYLQLNLLAYFNEVFFFKYQTTALNKCRSLTDICHFDTFQFIF